MARKRSRASRVSKLRIVHPSQGQTAYLVNVPADVGRELVNRFGKQVWFLVELTKEGILLKPSSELPSDCSPDVGEVAQWHARQG